MANGRHIWSEFCLFKYRQDQTISNVYSPVLGSFQALQVKVWLLPKIGRREPNRWRKIRKIVQDPAYPARNTIL